MDTTHDLIVIGAGMAGLNAVDRAVGDGRRIAVIERALIGGTCPTRGCIPSKALIRSAEVAHQARRAAEFGIRVGEVSVDFPAVMARVRAIIQKGSDGTRRWVESLDGVEIVEGDATFADRHTVVVDGRELTAPHIVIATGADPSVPPIPGLDRVPHWTSDDLLLRVDELPARLLVIGAGPIALELGQAMCRLGSKVTLVDIAPTLLPRSEPELVALLRQRLDQEGIALHLGVTIDAVRPGPQVALTIDGQETTLEADALLVATGRAPATIGLGLEHTAVAVERSGVTVDAYLATTEEGIAAAGDVVGPPFGAFTHVARRMGSRATANALDLDRAPADADVGPTAVFTDPELAAIGLTEAQAREQGFDVVAESTGFGGGRARAIGEEFGRAKVVIERGTRRLLGAHVLAYHAADMVNTLSVAMSAGDGAIDPIVTAYHIHPTMGEVIQSLVKAAASK